LLLLTRRGLGLGGWFLLIGRGLSLRRRILRGWLLALSVEWNASETDEEG
jgi:hypothetical protein